MKTLLALASLFALTSCGTLRQVNPDQIQAGADIAKLLIEIIPAK